MDNRRSGGLRSTCPRKRGNFIDGLIEDRENTNVEFKRELLLETVDQKSEFIKDVTALGNTQARGQRWMIIGLKSAGTYFGPPSPNITQDRIEDVINRYSSPR